MSELTQVLESIAELKTEFKRLENRVDSKIDAFNERSDNYRKATQWVVNLAFSLIALATVITVVFSVFRR